MGSTPILSNLVVVHQRNTHTKFEANPYRVLGEDVLKVKTIHGDDNNDDANDGHRVIARVTLTH